MAQALKAFRKRTAAFTIDDSPPQPEKKANISKEKQIVDLNICLEPSDAVNAKNPSNLTSITRALDNSNASPPITENKARSKTAAANCGRKASRVDVKLVDAKLVDDKVVSLHAATEAKQLHRKNSKKEASSSLASKASKSAFATAKTDLVESSSSEDMEVGEGASIGSLVQKAPAEATTTAKKTKSKTSSTTVKEINTERRGAMAGDLQSKSKKDDETNNTQEATIKALFGDSSNDDVGAMVVDDDDEDVVLEEVGMIPDRSRGKKSEKVQTGLATSLLDDDDEELQVMSAAKGPSTAAAAAAVPTRIAAAPSQKQTPKEKTGQSSSQAADADADKVEAWGEEGTDWHWDEGAGEECQEEETKVGDDCVDAEEEADQAEEDDEEEDELERALRRAVARVEARGGA
eukprot:CAMPEP_0206447090 /NCGR_PEP_ID=MMETSP0324_2-20121206/16558_1 /ASSEMBLY_ACC=CAM_ASM_000836 /TAXON_ID=2866 /ORGANISM="Crypthecodinium cohnii, Strain Seligo" /LENGTH=405 /DNA_ID=CAMNT_0053915753 /DNA_START=97 /DNA_END=1314 /DNA_ORIENTATION=+